MKGVIVVDEWLRIVALELVQLSLKAIDQEPTMRSVQTV